MKRISVIVSVVFFGIFMSFNYAQAESFQGQYISGEGDREYLELLDVARRVFDPDPEFQNLPMLYTPVWNGFVEGPTWGAWWIQNSYGTTYSVLPFLEEPYLTFLQNAQNLWFDQMGDGKTVRPFNKMDLIPPDGCLCDAASPGWFVAKQGDGRVDIHDWAMEFTAAGLVLQAELLLISRDKEAAARYVPKLERCADFLETRRDPKNNLFLAGPAGNLLAPSYAGYKKEDGTFDKAYLAGLSITTCAALNRLIELEKLLGRAEKVELYSQRRELAIKGLSAITTDEGYFVKSIDPDGTKHGVYGAEKHGYFEASPNHDAIAFRIAGDEQAEKIYQKIASIPGLRPHDLIVANCPGLDDMYTDPTGNWLWSFGTWVNGGHWSTCEARMILAYSRLGKYDDIRRSVKQIMTFARQFRMDNPLVDFGAKVYQPDQPINLCYDTLGPQAAMIRGLFEYLYDANGMTLVPHIPLTVEKYEQAFPIRLGDKKIFLSTSGSGEIKTVFVNGESWTLFDEHTITLPYERVPAQANIFIALGKAAESAPAMKRQSAPDLLPATKIDTKSDLASEMKTWLVMDSALKEQKLDGGYEAAHCRLGIDSINVIEKRKELKLTPLPEKSQAAADQSYGDTAKKIYDGFDQLMKTYGESQDAQKKKIAQLWADAKKRS